MAKYFCNWCESFFEEPKVEHDCNFSDGKYYVCPVCGEDDFDEAHECPSCNDDIKEDDILCASCQKAFTQQLNDLQCDYNVSDEEMQKLLENHIEFNF